MTLATLILHLHPQSGHSCLVSCPAYLMPDSEMSSFR